MVYSDTSTKQGIIQDIEFILFGDNGYGKITGDTTMLSSFARLVNNAQYKVETQILKVDSHWQFDDLTLGTYPIATTNLVSGQQTYPFDSSFLRILKVRAKDNSGNWQTLPALESDQLDDNPTSGSLQGYDKSGDSLTFNVPPNYSSTGGLEVTFQRKTNDFTSTDTTREPGIVSIFHPLISKWAAYDYALSRSMPIANNLRQEITVLEKDLINFYSNRSKDDPARVRIGYFNYFNRYN